MNIKSERAQKNIKFSLIHFGLIMGALFVLIPFYWMILTSSKTYDETQLIPSTLWPNSWGTLYKNFKEAFVYAPELGSFFLNTVKVGALTTLGVLVTSLLAAYAFAILDFKGKNFIFMLFIATMMVPMEMLIITNYTTIVNLKLTNTYWSLSAPFFVSVFYIFLLRQSIMQLPKDLYKAAKIDGTGDFRYLIRIIIPNIKSSIITVIILSMLATWNSYVWPNLITSPVRKDLFLVSNGLIRAFTRDVGFPTPFNIQMAATFLATIPILILFLLLKKYIMRGVSRSGIKG